MDTVRLRCGACGDETEATSECYSSKCSQCGGLRHEVAVPNKWGAEDLGKFVDLNALERFHAPGEKQS